MKKALAVLLAIAALAMATSTTVFAKPWKPTNYGAMYVMSEVPRGENLKDYSGMVIVAPVKSPDGYMVRSVSFGGPAFAPPTGDEKVCDFTVIIDRKFYQAPGVATAGKGGGMASAMVVDSTDPKYRNVVAGTKEFIDAIQGAKEVFVVMDCGRGEVTATYKPDMSYNEMMGVRF